MATRRKRSLQNTIPSTEEPAVMESNGELVPTDNDVEDRVSIETQVEESTSVHEVEEEEIPLSPESTPSPLPISVAVEPVKKIEFVRKHRNIPRFSRTSQ